MKEYALTVNGKEHQIQLTEGTSLLWVLREHLGLTGTKYGCGIAQCGSCTIHLDGKPVKSCVLSIDNLDKAQEITTIEGLSEKAPIDFKRHGSKHKRRNAVTANQDR